MEQTQQEQFIIRRIGGTTYKVRVAFSETAAETMEEKILRMIRNEGVTNDGTYAAISHRDIAHVGASPRPCGATGEDATLHHRACAHMVQYITPQMSRQSERSAECA